VSPTTVQARDEGRPPLGLYVHVPFCAAICNYCNFNRGLLEEALRRRYVDALAREIGRAADGSPADTIYFGGGTPSLLSGEDVGQIVAACRASFEVASEAEVTLEANPETVDAPRLGRLREAGVTRLSIGVQSFRDEELRRLGRVHDVARVYAAVEAARTAGFDNLSLDLMMWLPQQTLPQWRESVDQAIGLGPEHLSLYMLELYPNAPLREDMARAGWSQAPDDDAADMYLDAMARLERAGYRQYEISNVARAGRESRHNLKYWRDGEWLGFGCGAHGTRRGERWRNVSSTTEYVARMTAGGGVRAETRVLSAEDRAAEALITGLRLVEGVDAAAIGTRYAVDVLGRWGPGLVPFVDAGALLREGTRLRLSRSGMLLANEVLSVFV
jgi:oxygen-independent coproporphyrinogen-3 oxidase